MIFLRHIAVGFLFLIAECQAISSQSAIALTSSPTFLDAHHDQKAVLLDFYHATNGSSWDSSCRWNISESALTWFGVGINPYTGNVSTMTLDSCGIIGTIPSSLGSLYNLYFLDLRSNSLYGTIPPTIGEFQTLVVLDVGSNFFNWEHAII